ncbi:isochorismatase domain-containing protein [Drepanopeziza brunnea f. sp. 'multigermtubi' MB_m1]|uniref:Isochorismatase domain-containing protein n=1 Tax=Marssonina brunnea f. sp. multigermtubi (strain MB_m1) TaxID=1072389 RepID=K1Y811_MARBU|nr:isochorismatase domain-containing protein [Drepanopeziza brunnea f. sp. 'multigermtubi' MB_m1]EKD21264.1 isochorismatase domain-containing protein [Drepanopeziza brunnea f. sp. 'multigermtubi' MB_m1]
MINNLSTDTWRNPSATSKRSSAGRYGNTRSCSSPPAPLTAIHIFQIYPGRKLTVQLIYRRRIVTTQKLLKAAAVLSVPIYATTQNRARLGPTCAEIDLSTAVEHVDKTAFSMWIPEISQHFSSSPPSEIAIVGIETHICVTQTTLDLLAAGHKVYVLADGVSSCNKEEIGVALDRLRGEGAVITTSESWIYECMGDAGIPEFKAVAGVVKEYSGKTKEVVGALLGKSKI